MQDRVYAQPMAAVLVDPPRADEELMRDLARGQQEALGPLYSRYASLVFHLCVQSLDRPAAEELVQEVFLTMWRGAASFDPSRGASPPGRVAAPHWKSRTGRPPRRRRPAEVGDSGQADDAEPFELVADEE